MDSVATAPQAIRTEGIFPMMELPVELRLKIYPHLLVSSEDITINTTKKSRYTNSHTTTHLSVAILQTCKRINDEGTPILYSMNRFIVYSTMDPGPSSFTNSFLLRSLRWSSISCITSLSFIGTENPVPKLEDGASRQPRSSSVFQCTGADILARFKPNDFRYSPKGPDEYMALSVSNWISTQVLRVLLCAFQQELDAMMRPVEMLNIAARAGLDNPTVESEDEHWL